jgi:diaminopimelate decarboxylase
MPDLSLLPPSATIMGEDLAIGGCLITDIAERFGTPAYVVDELALRAAARQYVAALTARHARGRVCFAVKAFPSVAVIRVLAEEGLGCDVVGAGELRMALAADVDPLMIVMHGNAKSDEDIGLALDAGIGHIVIDGFDDIDRIERLACRSARSVRSVPALLRVSPGVESDTHSALATGGKQSKFGLPAEQVPAAIARIRSVRAIELRGLHAHIGSQITDVGQFEAAIAALASLERFDVYDFGGGLAVRYLHQHTAPPVDEYVGRVVAAAHERLGADVEILLEPGRSVVASAGLTLYRVVTVKRAGKIHVAVDGGMGDNLEHSLYGHRFAPLVVGRWHAEPVLADLVGRHCESGDVITPDVELADPRVGDLIVVPVTGAYCYTMANNYNGALRPPVVFCDRGRAKIAVRRETYDDLMAREVLGPASAEPSAGRMSR